MTKGSYVVDDQEKNTPPRRDTSYRSFICALLIFLFICLLILLITIGWGKRQHQDSNQTEGSEVLKQEVEKSNESHEKHVPSEATTLMNKLTTATFREINKETTVPILVTTKQLTEEPVTTEIVKTSSSVTVLDVTTTLMNKLTTDILRESDRKTTVAILVTTNQQTEEPFTENATTRSSFKVVEATTASSKTESETQNFSIVEKNVTQEDTEIAQTTTEETTVTQNAESKEEEELDDANSSTTSSYNSSESTTQSLKKFKKTESTTQKENQTILTTTSIPTEVTKISTTEATIMESEAVTEAINLRMISTKKTSNPVCDKAACKIAAAQILHSMNHSAVPCEDFYDFACGRFSKPDDLLQTTEESVLEKQIISVRDSSPVYLTAFSQFYNSCLWYDSHFDYRKRMDGVEDLLAQVGGFEFDNTTSVIDLTDIVSELLLRQSMPLFDIGIDVDKQSTNFILQLTLPHQSFLRSGVENWSGLSQTRRRCLEKQKSEIHGSHVNLTEIYDSYQFCKHDYSHCLNSIESVIRELNAFSNLSADSLLAEIKNIRFSIEFDVLNNLDSLPASAEILKEFINKNYEIRRISDLQLHYPLFNWKKLFGTLTGREVSGETLVQVYFAKYFKKTFTALGKIDKQVLNNAFLAIHAHDLFINTVLPKEQSNREQFCTKLSKKLLPDVWSHFAQLTYSTDDQNKLNLQVSKVFQVLKTNFCKSLLDAAWIDDNTKSAFVKKCYNLDLAFFAPPDEKELIRNYQNLNLTSNYQTNLIMLLSNYKRSVYSKQETNISAKTIFSHFLDPFDVKALTFYANTTIMVPLGLMGKASPDLPNYLVLVRVGFVLARQMARHFDPTGINYGINLKSTSKATYSNLVETMTTMMQYSSPRLFHGKNISFQLVGSLSNHERIVDNAAFRLILDSFSLLSNEDILPWISSQYSREKVFFIATAQELCEKTTFLDFMLQVFERRHLPAVLRIENIMGNSEQFARKFSCAEGSGMNMWFEKMQLPFLNTIEEEYEEE